MVLPIVHETNYSLSDTKYSLLSYLLSKHTIKIYILPNNKSKMNIHKQNGRKNKIKMKRVLRGTNSDYFTWVLMWENNPLIFRKDYLFCF